MVNFRKITKDGWRKLFPKEISSGFPIITHGKYFERSKEYYNMLELINQAEDWKNKGEYLLERKVWLIISEIAKNNALQKNIKASKNKLSEQDIISKLQR